jgi:flagellar protein FliT
MDARTHLALCESVARATGRMLDAARAGDWDMLVVAEKACAILVERLRTAGEAPALDASQANRKEALIRQMLADDAAIRDITQPELARLAKLLSASTQETRLARAYAEGAASGGATA